MPITVNHPVVGKVTFPDTATPQEINDALFKIGTAMLPEESSGSVFFNQLGEGLESSIEGISQLTGLDFYTDSYEDEFRNRVQLEQSPYAGYGGLLVGSILDPVTLPAAFLKPIAIGGKLTTGIARGATAGAVGGAIEPVFEPFDDSRLLNTTVGGVFGGALGGALSKFIAADVRVPTKQETDEGVDAALESVADVVEEPRIKSVDEVRQELEEELTARSKTGLTPDDEATLQKGIDERLKKVEQIENASAKRTKGLRATDDKAAGDAALEKFETIRTRLMDEVREMRLRIKKGQEGREAGEQLVMLRTGQVNKLTPELQARLIPTPEAPSVRTEAQPTAPPRPQPKYMVTQIGEDGKQKVVTKTADELTPEEMDELVAAGAVDAEEFAPLRTGLDPRESAGSAGVRPEQQYAGRAAEGVDEANLVASAWSRRRVEPAKSRGFDESDAELQRLGLREEAGAEQIERLKGHQFGPYRFEPNNAAEQAALDAIGKDYDSLVDFIIDMAEKGRAFSPFEQRVLEPLRADIEQRIQISYKTMRQMRREGAYRTTTWSQEEYDAAMELQFYSYIANAIDTNGTRASHSLKETQNIKAHRNRHSAKIKAGKPIDDIFGVKC